MTLGETKDFFYLSPETNTEEGPPPWQAAWPWTPFLLM